MTTQAPKQETSAGKLLREARERRELKASAEGKMPSPSAEPEVSLKVGVDTKQERVLLVFEVTGDKPIKLGLYYTQEEVAALALALVQAGQKLEELKPKPLIVLPGAAV